MKESLLEEFKNALLSELGYHPSSLRTMCIVGSDKTREGVAFYNRLIACDGKITIKTTVKLLELLAVDVDVLVTHKGRSKPLKVKMEIGMFSKMRDAILKDLDMDSEDVRTLLKDKYHVPSKYSMHFAKLMCNKENVYLTYKSFEELLTLLNVKCTYLIRVYRNNTRILKLKF